MGTTEELKALASQLRQPEGEKGIEVADMMNNTNMGMTLHAIEALALKISDYILELGHGNAGHLSNILKHDVIYQGLEISPLMQEQARRINHAFEMNGRASFALYNGHDIPFEAATFDKIFTVNTIYFWEDPVYLLQELYRVAKPQALVNITFAHKSFMENLPFTTYGFELYDFARLEQLVAATSFKILKVATQQEEVQSKAGDRVLREFSTVTLQR